MGDSRPPGPVAINAAGARSGAATSAPAEQRADAVLEWKSKRRVKAKNRRIKWLALSEWSRYITEDDMPDMFLSINPAKPIPTNYAEENLQRACAITKNIILEADEVCRNDASSLSLLKDITKIQVMFVGDNKVLCGLKNKRTIRKYANNWENIFRFISHNLSKHPIQLTKSQYDCYWGFMFNNMANNKDDKKIETSCLNFWFSLIMQELPDNKYENPLISAAAVLGWDCNWKEYKSPHAYKGILSSIITVMSMMVVLKIYKQRNINVPHLGHIERDSLLSQVKQLDDSVRQFIIPSSFESFRSPFNNFLTQERFKVYCIDSQANSLEW